MTMCGALTNEISRCLMVVVMDGIKNLHILQLNFYLGVTEVTVVGFVFRLEDSFRECGNTFSRI